jgi:cytolysin-activating lysine-acyltransferase
MQFEKLSVISPQFEAHTMSEAEVLGAAVWLWMHSATHQGAPLTALNTLLLPAIKTGQYLLAFEQGQPVAYVAWAQLDEPRETAYLVHASRLTDNSDWCSGERGWFTDYIASFGHARQIRRILTHRLFPTGLFRSLYHKGDDKGLRVMTFHGTAVHPLEARHWFEQHPVCWPTPLTAQA